jgi:DNA-binding transcriptional ArsR family regulator
MKKHDTKITLSLGEPKLKQISEILSNKTCNKILDFLATNDSTITEISKNLKIQLNTTEYNVKKLSKAGLIKSTSHWWSVKGKKMPVYTVSNKQIVISPKRPSSKKYLGAFLITGLASLIIRSFTSTKTASTENAEMIQEMVTTGAAEKLTLASKDLAVNVAERAISISVETSGIQSWEWFLLGTWFAIVLFMAFALVSERRGKK